MSRNNPNSFFNQALQAARPVQLATCDCCDGKIRGVRYKCEACPDFDYCESCYVDAELIHPGHTFKALDRDPKSTPSDVKEKKSNPSSPASDPVDNLCRSCLPVTKPLAAVHLVTNDPKVREQNGGKIPKEVGLRWPLRISRLVEATQRGCAFCAFVMERVFVSGNIDMFMYDPSKPWYAAPADSAEERKRAVENCMEKLKRLKQDGFIFSVTPSCRKAGARLPDFDRLTIALVDPKRSKEELTKARVFPSAGNITMAVDVYAAEDDPAADFVNNRPPNPSPGTEKSLQKVKGWMANCEENHGSKCKPSTADMTRLPSRVIEIGDEGKLRLHQTSNDEVGRYAALSYVWGEQQQFQTLSSTLEARIEGFNATDLPQTLQDAITVAKELGLRYLWVDSISIVQDDPNDKAHEVSRMAEIFKHAHVTICAARAFKASDGFLADKADEVTGLWKPMVPMKIALPDQDATNLDEALSRPARSIGTLWLNSESEGLSHAFPDPVSRRGWCLQERILSPRVLIYGRWPTWRCSAGFESDGGPNVQDSKRVLDDRLTELLLKSPGVADRPLGMDLFRMQSLTESWYKLVNDYTKRELGFASDRLPAIGGVAAEISRVTGVRYLAGLWENNLLHNMMWYADPREWLNRPDEWRAPSWSWAAVDCPVKYDAVTPDAFPLANVVSCSIKVAEEASAFGEVLSGRLSVRGPFAELKREDVLKLLDEQSLAPAPPRSNDITEWYRQTMENIANSSHRKQSDEDKEKEKASLANRVFGLMTFSRNWFIRYEDKVKKLCYFGLLLKESEEYPGCFERIGSFRSEASAWADQNAAAWDHAEVTLV